MRDEIGGTEVDAELGLELVQRGLVHAPADGEAAHQVDHALQGCGGVCRGGDRDGGDRVGLEQVATDQLQAGVVLDALELALGHPGHDDAPAIGK